MSESDSQTNRGSASDLFAVFLLFRTACPSPRRITTTPLESISSFLSFSLAVNLALVKGAVVAVTEAGPAHSTAPTWRGTRRTQSSPTEPALSQAALSRCRKEPRGLCFPFLQTWTIAEART